MRSPVAICCWLALVLGISGWPVAVYAQSLTIVPDPDAETEDGGFGVGIRIEADHEQPQVPCRRERIDAMPAKYEVAETMSDNVAAASCVQLPSHT